MTKLGDEGIFIFGGRLGSGEASDELKLVKLGSKPLFVKKLETKVTLHYDIGFSSICEVHAFNELF